ncbi:MAG: site-specific DNA-methyltransferase [Prevotella denticola]|uniref:site-specific DNA-methyltransferase n=1 Tax=Prevotella denticola TaxID=28129 RepID=UPI003F9ED61F
MEHLKMQSPDIVSENMAYIAQRWPECLTEEKDENGKLRQVIDFDKLRQMLSSDATGEGQERYQFTWPDKRHAIRLANTPTTDTLRPCREDSIDFDNTQNLYIEGDNLEVLKLLRESYLGKVKMIYIDPPYNTGGDFVYKDNFIKKNSDYAEISGTYDEEGHQVVDDFEKNVDSNGRFHTDWLNMIYPRLKVARDLLREDGVIFISIDDKEVDNLKKVCTELFGEANFVSNIIWQSRTSISNDDEVSTNHNHTLVYSKNREELTFGGDDIDADEYVNPDNDPRGPWKLVPIDANHIGGDTTYPIRNPKTGVDFYPPNGRIWCYNKQALQKLIDDNRIKFGLNDESSPKRKMFYNERLEKGDCKTPSSVLLDAGTTKTGTTEIMNLFDGEKVFDYPKPTSLVHRLIKYGAIRNDDVVLDFFSGSGTTAHAAFTYALKEKINCKTILVQYPENLDTSLITASTDAKKTIKVAISFLDTLGKPHNICEIAKERIRRAGKKIKEEHPDWKVDTGFRVLKLDNTNMENVFYTPAETTEQTLFADNIKPDRTDEDLLFQVMMELGIALSDKIGKAEIAGKTVWNVGQGYLMACFEPNVTEETITAIAKQQPQYFVIADRSMASDNVADNFEQLFEEYSPTTIRKIL